MSLSLKDKVSFTVKVNNQLVTKTGTVKVMLTSDEAKRQGLIKASRSGTVVGIRTATGRLYYKFASVVHKVRQKG